ncbi:hypothetical protein GCM10011328_30840 [Hafnia psychrotolerans]|uniref:Zinc ribbon domain-containing protein n=1 Tax=Hafnia psychrotolerans TaxID=1477018 RepID=A0ABQ1GZL0_9GAMM|nr:hypothetical protein GCM10011328_30840 [Hafnia psychrotolerans]
MVLLNSLENIMNFIHSREIGVFMKGKHINDGSVCGFCNSKLKTDPAKCFSCGAEMIKGYINSRTRKLISYLRVVFVLISALIMLFISQDPNAVKFLVFLAPLLILISLVLPWLFFKIKNRNNHIWRLKNMC